MSPQNQPQDYQPSQNYIVPPENQVRGPVGFTPQHQPQDQYQGQPQFQAQPQSPAQPQVSRRGLLRGGLIGGGLGLAVAAGAGAAVGLTRNSNPSLKPAGKPVVMAPMAPSATQGPLVAYISDPSTGLLDVYAGTGWTQVRNPGLVTQLLNNLQ